MIVEQFREEIALNKKIVISGTTYKILEIVTFRFDDGNFYIKCFLENGYVLADDAENHLFLLVREVKTDFKEPFGNMLSYQGKSFKFLYSAHAVAEKVVGETIFKHGDSENFWDFMAETGEYLSLGTVVESDKRLDFYGRVVKEDELSLV